MACFDSNGKEVKFVVLVCYDGSSQEEINETLPGYIRSIIEALGEPSLVGVSRPSHEAYRDISEAHAQLAKLRDWDKVLGVRNREDRMATDEEVRSGEVEDGKFATADPDFHPMADGSVIQRARSKRRN